MLSCNKRAANAIEQDVLHDSVLQDLLLWPWCCALQLISIRAPMATSMLCPWWCRRYDMSDVVCGMVYQMRSLALFTQLLLQDWQEKARSKKVRVGNEIQVLIALES
jgi:hypothetical protein